MSWIIDRLKEPSTYAGFAGLAAALGVSGAIYNAAAAALAGIFGLVAVLKSEGKI
jgi:hypothetical protein